MLPSSPAGLPEVRPLRGVHLMLGGKSFTVTARLLPKRMFSAASIDVCLGANPVPVLQSGGVPGMTGAVLSRFQDAGKEHTLVVRWGMSSGGSFPVTLELDGEASAPVKVAVSNMHMAAVPVLVPVVLVAVGVVVSLLLGP